MAKNSMAYMRGDKEFIAALKLIDNGLRREVVHDGLEEIGHLMKQEIKEATPVRTNPLGPMVDSAVEKTTRLPGNLRDSLYMDVGKGNVGPNVMVVGVDIKGWYWRLVELGHGGPFPASPHPFVRPVFNRWKRGRVVKELKTRLQYLIDIVSRRNKTIVD